MDQAFNAVGRVSSSDPKLRSFGTSFCVARDTTSAYFVTCAHVVDDVGGPERIVVDGEAAELVQAGVGVLDLAIVRVPGWAKASPLALTPVIPSSATASLYGYRRTSDSFVLSPRLAVIDRLVHFEAGGYRVPAWDLRLTDGTGIEPEYSGGPVIADATGDVLAITSHRLGMGNRGYAISTLALERLFEDPAHPPALDGVLAQLLRTKTVERTISVAVEVRPFVVRSRELTIYDTAGDVRGRKVYGRGQRLIVTLRNATSRRVDVANVALRLTRVDRTPPPDLKYDKLTMSLPHTRLPVEDLAGAVVWSDGDLPGAEKPLGEGWVRLGPAGSDDDVHQIGVNVEATSPGLWEYVVEARYDVDRGERLGVISDPQMILLRGR